MVLAAAVDQRFAELVYILVKLAGVPEVVSAVSMNGITLPYSSW
jgi:hypothetical protein